MGRYQLRFVVCTLCIILQCNISIQTPIKAKNDCNTVEIRIPISSISNKNSPPLNCQYGSSFSYPYYTQLSQYYANICNSCKGFLCNNKCSNSNPIKLKSPTNTLSLSVPSNSNSGRLTFVIDNRSPAKPAPDATIPPPNNGENNVDVIVKVVPIDPNSTNGTAVTSAQSSAKHNNDGNQIIALTTAQELDSTSTKDYEISVYVKDDNTGTTPLKTSLQSQIIAENADGDVLVSKTNSDIVKSAIPAADGDDTTVTGDTLPSVTPPLQAPPVIPESDAVVSDAPGPAPPPPGPLPGTIPPVDVPPPAPAPAPPVPAPAPPVPAPPAPAPPAPAPPAPAPPAESIDAVASSAATSAAVSAPPGPPAPPAPAPPAPAPPAPAPPAPAPPAPAPPAPAPPAPAPPAESIDAVATSTATAAAVSG